VQLTESEALALVQAWKVEAPLFRLPDDLKHKFSEPWQMSVRVVLAARNKTASDALWDGKSPEAVIRYLVKKGLPDKRHLNMKKEIGARTISRKGAEEGAILSPRLSGRHYAPQSDWKYVK
jgi:hypothetical protein